MFIDLYIDIISIFVLKIKILWILNNKKTVYFGIGYLNVSDIIGIQDFICKRATFKIFLQYAMGLTWKCNKYWFHPFINTIKN